MKKPSEEEILAAVDDLIAAMEEEAERKADKSRHLLRALTQPPSPGTQACTGQPSGDPHKEPNKDTPDSQ